MDNIYLCYGERVYAELKEWIAESKDVQRTGHRFIFIPERPKVHPVRPSEAYLDISFVESHYSEG